jgi:hypothetical protein
MGLFQVTVAQKLHCRLIKFILIITLVQAYYSRNNSIIRMQRLVLRCLCGSVLPRYAGGRYLVTA